MTGGPTTSISGSLPKAPSTGANTVTSRESQLALKTNSPNSLKEFVQDQSGLLRLQDHAVPLLYMKAITNHV